jgi:hypothetical protein
LNGSAAAAVVFSCLFLNLQLCDISPVALVIILMMIFVKFGYKQNMKIKTFQHPCLLLAIY